MERKLFEKYVNEINVSLYEEKRKDFVESILQKFDPAADAMPATILVSANSLFVEALSCYTYGFFEACMVMLRDSIDAAILYASNYKHAYVGELKSSSWAPIEGEFAHTVINVKLSPALGHKVNAKWDYLSEKVKDINEMAASKGLEKVSVSDVDTVRKQGSFSAHLAEASIKEFAEYVKKPREEREKNMLKQMTTDAEAKEAIEKTLNILLSVKKIYLACWVEDAPKQ